VSPREGWDGHQAAKVGECECAVVRQRKIHRLEPPGISRSPPRDSLKVAIVPEGLSTG